MASVTPLEVVWFCIQYLHTIQHIMADSHQPKDKTTKENACGVVYNIKCEGCDSEDIGETETSLRTHFMEHCKLSITTTKVSWYLHMDCPGHTISLEGARILDMELQNFERDVK